MEQAFEFLKQHKDVAFATVENGEPQIRAFRIMKQEGHTLWFATSPHKGVFRQLQSNPCVGLLAMDGDISVRISGKVVFGVPDDICREIYACNPILPRLYPDYTTLAYFSMDVEKMDYYDLTRTPPFQDSDICRHVTDVYGL